MTYQGTFEKFSGTLNAEKSLVAAR